MRRSLLIGLALLFASAPAAAADPLLVDPWLERVTPPAASAPVATFAAVPEIIDPWAGSAEVALFATDEIVDPWASHHPKIPTAAFPLLE